MVESKNPLKNIRGKLSNFFMLIVKYNSTIEDYSITLHDLEHGMGYNGVKEETNQKRYLLMIRLINSCVM